MDNSKEVSRIEKAKFRHCSHKACYFETFIRKDIIHYVVQCESRDFYVGVANVNFTLISFGSVTDRICAITYCKESDWLYLGSTKGHIHCWNLAVQTQKQWPKISSIHGNPIIAILAFREEASGTDRIVAFSKEGSCLYFQNFALAKQKKLPSPVHKIATAKNPENEEDIWAVIFLKEGPFPIVLDLVWVKKHLIEGNDSLQAGIQQYIESMDYDQDEQDKMPTQPVSVCISNELAIVAVAEQNEITIFTVGKREDKFYLELDFRFQQNEVREIDLTSENLLFSSDKSLVFYNLEKRRKIAKNLTNKTTQNYDLIRWANFGKEIIFGSLQANNMKLLHSSLNLI